MNIRQKQKHREPQGKHRPQMEDKIRQQQANPLPKSFTTRHKEISNDEATISKKVLGLLFILLLTMAGVALFVRQRRAQEKTDDDNNTNNTPSTCHTHSVDDMLVDMHQHLQKNVTNACKMAAAKNLCAGNLDVPRKHMPQLSSEVAEKYFAHKQKAGIKISSRQISSHQLFPTQNELHAGSIMSMLKSAKAGTFKPCDNEVIVAQDPVTNKKHIIDGHHRVMACQLTNGRQNIKVIHDSAQNVLQDLQTFDGVTMEDHVKVFVKPW